jgi:hypothetical protein
MFADLIIYIHINLFAAGAIRCIGHVCSIYKTQAVDSTLNSPGATRMH